MADVKSALKSQYLAALEMLRRAVDACPEELWHVEEQPNKFWHTAYHVLFYTHFYLHPTEADYQPWDRHRPEITSLSPGDFDSNTEPVSRADVLEYIAFCKEQVGPMVDALNLSAPSGFDWLSFNKLELQVYNIRHVQQHTGELYQQLAEASVELHWVGMGPTA